MDIDWLQEAYRRTRKDGAAGVDGMTAEQYEANLKSNLEGLLGRVKAWGTYRAPPVRRVHIPKGNAAKREAPHRDTDAGGQGSAAGHGHRAGAIYEQDFYDCSFAFRPRRSARQALEVLSEQTMNSQGAGFSK